MYKKFYNLNDNPFGLSPDPRYLFATPATREALACLEYGISTRKGFIVVTGEVGTGKTMLLRSALDSIRGTSLHSAFLFNPRMEVLDFLEFVLLDFGIPLQARTKSGMLQQLNHWLIERFAERHVCVLIVDEAQNLSFEMLEEIRLLTNLETSSGKLLQIVLSGQPELERKLSAPNIRQLRQRVSLRCRMQRFDLEDTAAYIGHRLFVAGTSEPVFSPNALRLIHHYSHGIPRVIHLICEHSLTFGFVEQARIIQEHTIMEVVRELDLLNGPTEMSAAETYPQQATDRAQETGPDQGRNEQTA